MPSKYSHSVVLASQGIINLPDGQQVDSSKPRQTSPPNRTPQAHSRGRSAPVIIHRAGAISFRHPSTPFSEPVSERLKQPIPNQGHSNGLDTVSDQVGGEMVATEPLVQDVATKDLQPRQPLPPGVQKSPNPKPFSPFDLYLDDPGIALNASPLASGIKDQQGATLSTHVRRPASSRVRKYHLRNDVKELRHHREYHSPHVPTRTTDRPEPRLSLQQFLDSLPRVDDPEPEVARRSPVSSPKPENRDLSLSPAFQPKGLRPAAQTKSSSQSLGREGTSFIDSSDEEDEIPLVSKPPSAVPSNNYSEKHGRLDLTEEVHLQRAVPRLSLEEGTPERQAHSEIEHRHSKRYSTDVDDSDGFDPLPLQRHSPLPKLKSLIVRESAYQGRALFDIPDDQLSPIPIASTTSPDSATQEVTVSDAEPDRPGFADVDEGPRNRSRSPTTLMSHMHYARETHGDSPTSEQRAPILRSREAKDRRETTSPPHVAPASAPRKANIMDNFGIPSIVRISEEQAMGSTRIQSPDQSLPELAVAEVPEKQRRKPFILSRRTKQDEPTPSEQTNESRFGRSKDNIQSWPLPTVEPSKFGELTTEAFGQIAIYADGPRGQRQYQGGHANVKHVPVPDDAADTDTDEWDDETDEFEFEYEVEDDDDDEEDGDDAALPPPDISRHRRRRGAEEGTETMYPAVDSGHDGISQREIPMSNRDGNDRLDAALRETRVAQTQRRKTKAQSVLGRLMRR